MIIEALVSLIRSIVTGVLGLFPTGEVEPFGFEGWTMPTSIADAVFPFGQFVAAIAVLLGWTVICHGYRFVLWLLGVIHISGDSA